MKSMSRKDQCLVSVVIPSYNRSDVIGRAVTSVLAQSHQNFEVIVVDDASSDGECLKTALAACRDPRIRLIRHEENKGGAAARNTGVADARGEIIAFLDSDDEWLPCKLEKQLHLVDALEDDNWLIYCQSEVHTVQGGRDQCSVMPGAAIGSNESIGNYLFVGRGWLPTPAMMLPRSLASRVPFNPELRRHQDYDLLLRLEAGGCRFRMVPEILVVVHWEDLHQTARGLNPAGSVEFLRRYRRYLSPQARSGFINGQVVSRLLREKRRWESIKYSARYVRPWHVSLSGCVSMVSGFLFGDARLALLIAQVRRGALK